jgi:WD40 repeat protein
VCALEFEEHGWLLASAGVSKQVRVYSLASRLQHPDDDSYLQPLRCHRMPSKLSCLAWNPDAPGTVTVADYDGVLSQVDMESGHLVAEVDEHSGRRVWSVHHSVQRPHLCASASEDGTVRLWGGPAMHTCIGALRPSASGAPACGVRLSPFDGNLAAVACADHSAYLYDLRRADRPLLQLAAHSRAVSYVRWLSASSLVTASTDATLALWQLPGPQAAAAAPPGLAAAGEQQQAVPALLPASGGSSSAAAAVLSQPVKRFRGHQNQKNFVGLSVRPEDGLMACGSEAPAAYAYHTAWSSPLAVHTFSSRPGASTGSGSSSGSDASPSPAVDDLFCSAVCLQPAMARPVGAPPLMATALSSGEVRVLELQRSVAAAAQRRCMDG